MSHSDDEQAGPVVEEPVEPRPPSAEAPLPEAPLPETPSETITWELLAVLGIAFFPSLWSGVIRMMGHNPGWDYQGWPFALYALHFFFLDASLAVAVLYILHRSGEPWSYFGFTRPDRWDLAWGIGLLAAQLCAWAFWAQNAFFFQDTGFGEVQTHAPSPRSRLDHALVLPMNLSVAVFEETVFRGYLLARLPFTFKHPVEYVPVSAVLFALIHVDRSLYGIVEIMVVTGLLYGLFFHWTRRLWPCILAHTLWNAMIYWRLL